MPKLFTLLVLAMSTPVFAATIHESVECNDLVEDAVHYADAARESKLDRRVTVVKARRTTSQENGTEVRRTEGFRYREGKVVHHFVTVLKRTTRTEGDVETENLEWTTTYDYASGAPSRTVTSTGQNINKLEGNKKILIASSVNGREETPMDQVEEQVSDQQKVIVTKAKAPFLINAPDRKSFRTVARMESVCVSKRDN